MNLLKSVSAGVMLALVSTVALAHGGHDLNVGSPDGFVRLFIYLIVVGLIFGIAIFLVRKAPMIPPEVKTVIEYVLYFAAAIFAIYLLLSLI